MKRLLLLAVLFTVALAGCASASPSCPTYKEARAAHATSWLYWHGKGHCWDASRGRHQAAPVKEIKRKVPVLQYETPRQGENRFEDPPIFNIRWPNEGTMHPARWLNELAQFGRL
jgi:hypothetical protein